MTANNGRSRRHPLRIALLAVLFVALLTGVALAWYFTANELMMGQVDGGVDYLAKYFESGDGTETIQYDQEGNIIAGPYEIAYPDQFYNLAWLQYLGYFNDPETKDDQGNEIEPTVPPTYFYLSTDLDMSGYVLPPIGTDDNPFISSFDGKNHTLSNLKIANVVYDGQLDVEELPLEVREKQNSTVTGVQIIGLFGVVGELPEGVDYSYTSSINSVSNLNIVNLTVETQTDTALIGLVAGYVNAPISNVGVANSTITIADGTDPVDAANLTANISDYSLVGYCTDDYKTMVKQDETVTKRYLLATVPVLVNQAMNALESGQDATWGGSIDMQSLHARLLTKFNAATKPRYISAETRTVDLNGVSTTTNTTTANTNTLVKNAPWDGTGQYSFSLHTTQSTTQYLYLTGEDEIHRGAPNGTNTVSNVTKTISTTYTYEGVKLENNGHYLVGAANGVSAGTNANNATIWVIDAQAHNVYCWINGTKYYLRYNGSALSMSTTTATTWNLGNDGCLYYNNSSQALYYNGENWVVNATASATETYCYIKIGNYGYLYRNSTTQAGTPTVVANRNNASQWTQDGNYYRLRGTTNMWLQYRGNSATQAVYVRTNTTNRYYLNNGYLYSGSYYLYYTGTRWQRGNTTNRTPVTIETETETTVYDKTFVQTATTGTYTVQTTEQTTYGAIATFFPINVTDQGTTADSNTGYVVSGSTFQNDSASGGYPYRSGDIRVSHYPRGGNQNTPGIQNSWSNNQLSTVYTQTASGGFHRITNENELKNYKRVKEFMEGQLKADSNVYGLHFMDATIGTSIVRIPTASIFGETMNNYPVPSDCIDFNLKDAGYISFMAGSYFPGNTAFFSLYEIVGRDEDTHEITASNIKQIAQIYGDPSNPAQEYVYTYVGGGSSGSTAGLSLLFDTTWITNPSVNISSGTYYGSAFYYEIPVNAGEYALGSVAGENGAYLMYLDIGANGRITSKYAWIATTEDTLFVEDRVDRFGVPAGVDFAPVGTIGDADATVALTSSGSITFSRSGDVITGTSTGSLGQKLTFLRDDAEATASYVKNGNTLTESEVELDTYNETDWLDAPSNTQPAFDTYGVDHQTITRTLTVRLHDLDAIEDSFTISYTYEKDGILEDSDDPVTVLYADPLIYMVQYDSSKIASAPTLVGTGNDFKGTVYIGLAGENSTLTQLAPAGTKTIRPADKLCLPVYGGTELFRVYGSPAAASTVAYTSVLNQATEEQDFTYNVAGTALEDPIIADLNSGCAVSSSSATTAVLTYTLAAPVDEDAGNRTLNALNTRKLMSSGLKGLQSISPLGLSSGKSGGLSLPDASLEADPDETDEALEEGSSGIAVYRSGAEDPAATGTAPTDVVENGSRVDRIDAEHVTRYYECFPEDPEADEGGWILVLEIYDPGWEPLPPAPQIDPETGYEIDPETGELYDPATGFLYDRDTDQLVDPESGTRYDRETGYAIDPATGWFVDPDTGDLIDPATIGDEDPDGDETTTGGAIEVTTGSAITTGGAIEVTTGSAITTGGAIEVTTGSAITTGGAIEVTSGPAIDTTTGGAIDAATGPAIATPAAVTTPPAISTDPDSDPAPAGGGDPQTGGESGGDETPSGGTGPDSGEQA